MVGDGGESQRGRGVAAQKEKNEPFFPTNQWQWWVIFPNFTKSNIVEHPMRYSTKSMDLGAAPPFFWSRSTVELLELDMLC
jgi:hypothetical protein